MPTQSEMQIVQNEKLKMALNMATQGGNCPN